MAIYPYEIWKKKWDKCRFSDKISKCHTILPPEKNKFWKHDFKEIVLCPWWPNNTWLTLVHILVNHSFSIFNTISFFNPYALLYSHVVKVQRSKLFITSTSWMFRPMSACKQSQSWSEVNEHAQDLSLKIGYRWIPNDAAEGVYSVQSVFEPVETFWLNDELWPTRMLLQWLH